MYDDQRIFLVLKKQVNHIKIRERKMNSKIINLNKKIERFRKNSKLSLVETEKILQAYEKASLANIEIGRKNRQRIYRWWRRQDD